MSGRELFQYGVGFAPGAEFFLENAPLLYPRVPSNEEMMNFEGLEMIKTTNQRFLQAYPYWKRNYQACIDEAEKLADEMDTHHYHTKLTHVGTSIVGIFGGAVTITGLALIPVSFGASLGLSIAGVTASSIAALIRNGASNGDASKQKECLEKAMNILNYDKDMRKILHQVTPIDAATTVFEDGFGASEAVAFIGQELDYVSKE